MADVKDVFLFVNPTSGGNMASAYTKLEKEEVDLKIDDHGDVRIHIFDIRKGSRGEKPGFVKLKNRIEELKANGSVAVIRVMVAGGDGTVMWSFSELQDTGVPPDKVCVGVIPFGTGNDFSRTMGWGGKPPGNLVGQDMKGLKGHCKNWLDALQQPFDLWEVEVTVCKEGSLKFVDDHKKCLTDGMKKQHNITYCDQGIMTMKKPMCNYFSIGYDGRVGLGFEKNRTKSQTGNLIVYFKEGFKKAFFKKAPTINKTLKDIQIQSENGEIETIVKTQQKYGDENVPLFRGDPVDLVFLNIPSIGKGANVWAKTSTLGVQYKTPEKMELAKDFQVVGDKQLTVCSYTSCVSFANDLSKSTMGCHACVTGGKRVTQTKGEAIVNFQSKEDIKADNGRVYMQIDGEFFVTEFPNSVKLRYLRQVKVLRNEHAKEPGCCAAPKHFCKE